MSRLQSILSRNNTAKLRLLFVSLSFLTLLLLSGALSTTVSAYQKQAQPSAGVGSSTIVANSPQTTLIKAKLMKTTAPLSSYSQSAAPQSSMSPQRSGSIPDRSPVSPSSSPSNSFDPNSIPAVTPSAISSTNGGSNTAKGLNSFDNFGVNGQDLEPPDQGICAGNGYVVETINVVATVYSSSFKHVASDVSLMTLVGFPIAQLFGSSPVGGGYILSDPRCLFDPSTGHWFISFLYLGGAGVYSKSGPFPLGTNTYGAEFILVSTTLSPLGSYHVYFINVTNAGQPGCPCFGDQPLLGSDANSIIQSTNQFGLFAPTFDGAQMYFWDKVGLADGYNFVNVVTLNTGLLPTPDGKCQVKTGLNCWWSVNPADSPTKGDYDTSAGGTAWAISALDFKNNAFGVSGGDNRIAMWSFGNTQSLHSFNPALTLRLTVLTHVEHYTDPIFSTDTDPAGFLVSQKIGPIPLGTVFFSNGGIDGVKGFGCRATCHVGHLASNDDRIGGSVVYAQGAVWGALNTIVNQGTGANPIIRLGAAFFVVRGSGTSTPSLVDQGYVAPSGQNVDFPAFAVGPSGNAVLAFTLEGPGYFPSTGFAWISPSSSAPVGNTVYISANGRSPYDGGSEYYCVGHTDKCTDISPALYRPRYGDYSWGVWNNGVFYFASEYVQYPNCSPQAFVKDPSCGGTRTLGINWGSSLNSVG